MGTQSPGPGPTKTCGIGQLSHDPREAHRLLTSEPNLLPVAMFRSQS